MTEQLLVLGDRRDRHLCAVVDAVQALGGPETVVVDAPGLATEPYAVVDGESLTIGETRLSFSLSTSGWLRRSAPTLWGAGLVSGGLEAVRRRAFLALVGSIARIGHIRWLTPLDHMLRAEDRLLQLEIVRELGHRTPQSVVTSSGDQARDLLGERFVVKPLAMGYFDTPDGPRAVFTSELGRDELEQVDFADAPFVAQERIDAVEHLRVVTVGEQAWVASLSAEGRPLDWRRQDEAHESWMPAHDEDVAAAAISVATSFGLGFSSQDWIRDQGEHAVFVDLNPGGQWLFLPDEVSAPATSAIAHSLIEPP